MLIFLVKNATKQGFLPNSLYMELSVDIFIKVVYLE